MDNNAPVIDTKKNAAKFYKVVETYIKRDGINDLMDWLGSTDFFEAPASTRFHGSYEGGLCQPECREVAEQIGRRALPRSVYEGNSYACCIVP